MTPEIPEYVLLLESVLRPFVMTIALGLIWLGAARMPTSAKSRYTTAGVLSAVFLGWYVYADRPPQKLHCLYFAVTHAHESLPWKITCTMNGVH